LVIERDRGDCRYRWAPDHIGGVEPPTEPSLEQNDVGRRLRECEKGRRRRDLEKGDRRAAIRPLTFF
jgi:hypothetical protein